MKKKWIVIVSVAFVFITGSWAAPISAEDSEDQQSRNFTFGGPGAVEIQIMNDGEIDLPLFFKSYNAWKVDLAKKTGFSFEIDYTAVWLGADSSLGDDEAAGGIVRIFGSWNLTGRGNPNNGALVWKVEHRHAFTDVAPSNFASPLGYIGSIDPTFSDNGARLTNLYWRQKLNGGRTVIIGGWLDAGDYVDVYSMADTWTTFRNQAFSTGTTTMAVPAESFGFAGSMMQKSVSAGFGYQWDRSKDFLGVGLNWGEPNEETWGPGLDDQFTVELFYRWQISKAFAITPDLQYFKNPAMNPEADSIWVFGLRIRGVL